MEKNRVATLLNNINKSIKTVTEKQYKTNNWYSSLFDEIWEEYDEIDSDIIMTIEDWLAIESLNYHDLIPVLREIIEGIININNKRFTPVNVNSEWSGGAFFAGRLALTTKSKEDIMLFARHLATRDIDHEASPYDFFGVTEIFSELGYTDDTTPVILGVLFANSQHRYKVLGSDNSDQYFKEETNVNKFLKELTVWYNEYDNISSIYNAFDLVLANVLKIDEDDVELAEEKFIEMVEGGQTPTMSDFLDLYTE